MQRLSLSWTPKWVLLLFSTTLLVACGGSSDKEDSPSSVTPVTCENENQRSVSSVDQECPAPVTGPEVLALESNIDASLREGETRLYQVDSEAEISLISNTGDVDLLLFDEVDEIDSDNPYRDEDLLCGSWWGFKEDHCRASTDDGTVYALVIAEVDSDYSIRSTKECAVASINDWVYRNMLDYYLYASEVPVVDPASYTDPAQLVRDLRFEEQDPFSYIRDAQAQINYYEEGIEFGLGYSWTRDDQDNLRIQYVYKDSAFGRAGVKRGDIAVSINDIQIDDMSNEIFYDLIGNVDNPRTSNWEFIDGETRETKQFAMTIGEYRINSVLKASTYIHPSIDGEIGYLVFKQFIEPSVEELNNAIDWLKGRGVTELVLDLRYNGGGRSHVSRRLGGQLAGPSLDGNLHSQFTYNEKYQHFNYEEYFYEALPALNLSRVVVLTTGRTASASERLINSLRPYIEVVTLGSTTRGKPFRSSGRQFCGKILNAMHVEGRNANGVSVLGGIPADCYAADDITRDFGELEEAMLSSALDYVVSGTCAVAPQIAHRSRTPDYPETYEALRQQNLSDEGMPER